MPVLEGGNVPRFQISSRTVVMFSVGVMFILLGCTVSRTVSASENLSSSERSRQLRQSDTGIETNEAHTSSSSASPELVKTCGPAQLTGFADFGGMLANWLPWSQVRTGTTCRKVSFRKQFANVNDVRLFVSADRTESERNGHLTPIVWAEKIRQDAFDVCVHFKSDYDDEPKYWKENVMVSWWAIDCESKSDASRRYLGRVMTNLERNQSVCEQLPDEVNPHSNTVLVSTSHPGLSYEKSYSYEGTAHTARESVVSWLDERANNTFDVCAKRLYEKTPGKIEGAGIDVLSVARNDKRYTGLTKIRLEEYGRGCVYVDVDLTKVGSADDETEQLPHVFVQARINKQDRNSEGLSPQVAAWVEQKLTRGFTVCAKNLARGVFDAKHTIQIHWIAVNDVASEQDSSVCREGAADT